MRMSRGAGEQEQQQELGFGLGSSFLKEEKAAKQMLFIFLFQYPVLTAGRGNLFLCRIPVINHSHDIK